MCKILLEWIIIDTVLLCNFSSAMLWSALNWTGVFVHYNV